MLVSPGLGRRAMQGGGYLPLAGGTISGPLLLPDGSAAAPSLAFSSAPTQGIYVAGAGWTGFTFGGTLIWRFSNTQLANVSSGGIYTNTLALRQTTGGINFQESDGTGGCKLVVNELTSPSLSGASSTFSAAIPAGARLVGVCARVTTTITGATSWKLGTVADDDNFGATLALAAGTTTTHASYTAVLSDSVAARDVVVTANGANFTAGVVKVYVSYFEAPAPTG